MLGVSDEVCEIYNEIRVDKKLVARGSFTFRNKCKVNISTKWLEVAKTRRYVELAQEDLKVIRGQLS